MTDGQILGWSHLVTPDSLAASWTAKNKVNSTLVRDHNQIPFLSSGYVIELNQKFFQAVSKWNFGEARDISYLDNFLYSFIIMVAMVDNAEQTEYQISSGPPAMLPAGANQYVVGI